MRVLKEQTIQKKVVAMWRGIGCEAIKLTMNGPMGVKGWPDYMFLGPTGVIFFIEFKAPGGACTDLQLARHETLRKLGFKVYVCDNVGVGWAICKKELTGRTS